MALSDAMPANVQSTTSAAWNGPTASGELISTLLADGPFRACAACRDPLLPPWHTADGRQQKLNAGGAGAKLKSRAAVATMRLVDARGCERGPRSSETAEV